MTKENTSTSFYLASTLSGLHPGTSSSLFNSNRSESPTTYSLYSLLLFIGGSRPNEARKEESPSLVDFLLVQTRRVAISLDVVPEKRLGKYL